MTFLQGTRLLAGTLGLALLVVLPVGAQQPEPQAYQQSQAYQRGYQQGVKDGKAYDQPNPGSSNLKGDSDRTAYRNGYQAGYCHDQASTTGYYNGTYSEFGPPMIRNGYYGYNAPNAYCESASHEAPPRPQAKPGPQNNVEYGGAG